VLSYKNANGGPKCGLRLITGSKEEKEASVNKGLITSQIAQTGKIAPRCQHRRLIADEFASDRLLGGDVK